MLLGAHSIWFFQGGKIMKWRPLALILGGGLLVFLIFVQIGANSNKLSLESTQIVVTSVQQPAIDITSAPPATLVPGDTLLPTLFPTPEVNPGIEVVEKHVGVTLTVTLDGDPHTWMFQGVDLKGISTTQGYVRLWDFVTVAAPNGDIVLVWQLVDVNPEKKTFKLLVFNPPMIVIPATPGAKS